MDYAIRGIGKSYESRLSRGIRDPCSRSRPQGIIMQHAPYQKGNDGFAGYPLDSLEDQIHIAELLSRKPVIAVTINHEGIPLDKIDQVCREIEASCDRPTIDPLLRRDLGPRFQLRFDANKVFIIVETTFK